MKKAELSLLIEESGKWFTTMEDKLRLIYPDLPSKKTCPKCGYEDSIYICSACGFEIQGPWEPK